MRDPSRVRVSGPLAPFAAGFAAELARQGYTPNSQGLQLQLLAHLSRWLADEGLDSHGLSATEAERFLATRRAAGYAIHTSAKALRPLITYLRELGAAPAEVAPAPDGRWMSCSRATGATSPPSEGSPIRPPVATSTRSARS